MDYQQYSTGGGHGGGPASHHTNNFSAPPKQPQLLHRQNSQGIKQQQQHTNQIESKVVMFHNRLGNVQSTSNMQQQPNQSMVVGVSVPAKTRNITQMPALKSSPAQQSNQQHQMKLGDIIGIIKGSANKPMPPKIYYNQLQTTEKKPSHPLQYNHLIGAMSARRDSNPAKNLASQQELNNISQPGSLHQRGQSMFEVQRSLAHLSNGLANHQKLQIKALAAGDELGLEEHLPQSQDRQYSRKRRETVKETEEDEDMDEHEEKRLHTPLSSEGEEDCDDCLGTEEFRVESPARQNLNVYQDSPGFQKVKIEKQGSSQEGNIPKSSHSSEQSNIKEVSGFQGSFPIQRNSRPQYNNQDSFEKNQNIMTPQILKQDSFRLNPKPIVTQVSQHQETAQVPTQFARFNNFQPAILRQQQSQSSSSFLSAHAFKNSIPRIGGAAGGVGSIPPKSQHRKQDCNETVEDENDFDVVVSPNLTGVAMMHNLDFFQKEEMKESIISKPPRSAATSAQIADWASNRSSADQKFGKLQKLESKKLKQEEVSPIMVPNPTEIKKLETKDYSDKGSTERFGDLSKLPAEMILLPQKMESSNYIGPNPTLQKNHQVKSSISHGRVFSNNSRQLPIEKLSDDDGDHLSDPLGVQQQDPETENLKKEFLKLQKTLIDLRSQKTSISQQQYDTKKSFDRRKTAQPVTTKDQKQIQEINNNNASKYLGIHSPHDSHSRQRLNRPSSQCINEQQQNLYVPSSVTSELNFSKANIVTVESRLHPPPLPLPLETKPVLSNSQDDDFDKLSHSPRIQSQSRLGNNLAAGMGGASFNNIKSYQPNTTKVTRRRKVFDQHNNTNHSSEAASSYSSPKETNRAGGTFGNLAGAMKGVKQQRVQIQEQQQDQKRSVIPRGAVGSSTTQAKNKQKKRMRYSYEDDDEQIISSDQEEIVPKGGKQYSQVEGDDERDMSSGEKAKKGKKSTIKKMIIDKISQQQQANKKTNDRKQIVIIGDEWNINMNSVTGATPHSAPGVPNQQYIPKQEIPLIQSNDEILQRQIIQSQQYLLAAFAQQQQQYQFQHNPQLLLQQQLAFQQQQLIMSQQAMFTQPHLMGMNQFNNPLGMVPPILGMQQSQQNFSDLAQQYPMNQISASMPGPMSQMTQQIQLKDNLMGKDQSMTHLANQHAAQSYQQSNQGNFKLYPEGLDGTPSPQRRNGTLGSISTYGGNLSQALTRLISPRENAPDSQFSQLLEDQPAFSKRIHPESSKNRPLQNQTQLIKTHSEYNNPPKQINSRNIPISQNYSSPIKNLLSNALNSTVDKHPQSANRRQGDNDNYQTINNRLQKMDSIGTQNQRKTVDATSRNQQEYGQIGEASYHRLEPRKTGQFGQQILSHRSSLEDREVNYIEDDVQSQQATMRNKTQALLIQDRQSSSPESIEERVIVKNTLVTIQKQQSNATPKQNSSGIKLDLRSQYASKEQSRLLTPHNLIRNSLNPTPLKLELEQTDNQGEQPQAIMIGFEDTQQIKDPFVNKPALKNRDQKKPLIIIPSPAVKDLNQRSKSAKGIPVGNNAAIKNRIAQINNVSQQIQLKSPSRGNETMNSPGKEMSQMKRAVIAISKEIEKPNIEMAKQKRPATSKAMIPQDLTARSTQRVTIKDRVQQASQPNLVNIDLLQHSKTQDNSQEDFLDPSHNRNLPIEICISKTQKPQVSQVSLASMFQAKMGSKLQHDSTPEPAPTTQHDKKEKTKQELFELRRQMMKSRVKRKEDNFGGAENNHEAPQQEAQSDQKKPNVASQTQQAVSKQVAQTTVKQQDNVMVRLAHGQKTQIDKKEMKRLTNKNYNNLPEIKKKREEEVKKQENQARKAATQEYLKQLDETRKKKAAAVQKKRAQIIDQGLKDING